MKNSMKEGVGFSEHFNYSLKLDRCQITDLGLLKKLFTDARHLKKQCKMYLLYLNVVFASKKSSR